MLESDSVKSGTIAISNSARTQLCANVNSYVFFEKTSDQASSIPNHLHFSRILQSDAEIDSFGPQDSFEDTALNEALQGSSSSFVFPSPLPPPNSDGYLILQKKKSNNLKTSEFLRAQLLKGEKMKVPVPTKFIASLPVIRKNSKEEPWQTPLVQFLISVNESLFYNISKNSTGSSEIEESEFSFLEEHSVSQNNNFYVFDRESLGRIFVSNFQPPIFLKKNQDP